MENNEEQPGQNRNLTTLFADWLTRTWKQVNAWTQKDKSDSIVILVLKVFLQILLFLIFLALSPLIILGFIIAFIAVI